ncbi:MAG: hypothetical protein LBO04_07520 [Spirochaetaceae bacterium]|jgi:hypothetical protein|nr:hypothetical protein [Spirochaetaceae bacterium]
MKWLKQTFAQRYNRDSGRTGHLWGDRYWSRILEGEPPDGGGAGEAAGDTPACGVRPRSGRRADLAAFSRLYPLPAVPAPG